MESPDAYQSVGLRDQRLREKQGQNTSCSSKPTEPTVFLPASAPCLVLSKKKKKKGSEIAKKEK